MNYRHPHDRIVRKVFSMEKYALDLFRLIFLPDEFMLFDWTTLTGEMNNLIGPDGKEVRCDLVFSVRLVENPSEEVKVVLLIEHKSYQDAHLFKQLLNYQASIYHNMDHGVILPILIYHGEKKDWGGPLNFQDSRQNIPQKFLAKFKNNILNFKVKLLNLQLLDIARQAGDLTTRPILFILQHGRQINEEVVVNCYAMGRELKEEDRTFLLGEASLYMNEQNLAFDRARLEEIGREVLRGDEIMPTLREEFMKEGLEQGKKEGLKSTALRMLKDGLDMETIRKYTGLLEREIRELKRSASTN